MEKICMNTEVAIDFLRGDKTTVEKLRYYADKEELCISSPTLLVLLVGIKKADAVKQFTNSINILPFDKLAATFASKIMEECKEKGVVMDWKDLITASVCLSNRAFLFTKNRKDFEHVKTLKLV
ncbi:type II toxin-antitoxin system VapC family toxin [Candidatus Micrarchaeota archaeon]|nr:type II toxin-antitoxin system VapC family toxin [Candidatus Micrarchaeota archaeon]